MGLKAEKEIFHEVNPAFLGYHLAKSKFLGEEGRLLALFPEDWQCLDFLATFAAFSGKASSFYPEPETIPFAESIVLNATTFERIKVLWELPRLKAVACTPKALMRKAPSLEALRRHYLYVIPGVELSREDFTKELINLGYERVGVVEEKGSFSVKGAVIDLFSPQYDHPVRIEFFGDEVISLRLFDSNSQRSLRTLDELVVLPAREAFFPNDIARVYERVLALREKVSPERIAQLLSQVEHRTVLENEDFVLPILFEDLRSLPENIDSELVFLLYEPESLVDRAYEFWERVEAFASRAVAREKLLMPKEMVYASPEELMKLFEGHRGLIARELPLTNEGAKTFKMESVRTRLSAQTPKDRLEQAFWLLLNLLDEGYSLHIFVSSNQSQEAILSGLKGRGAEGFDGLRFEQGRLHQGFIYPLEKVCVTSEAELFGKGVGAGSKAKARSRFRRFEDLKPKDLVVHRSYGIGRYLGLKTLAVNGMEGDFLEIEYAEGDRLYLPPTRLDELYPYVGISDREPKLDKLGKQTFLKRRKEVETRLTEVVQEILTIYAERKAIKGFSLEFPALAYQQLANTFPYEETPDQASAIEEVIADLCQDKLMERLVVGDVGFGKTEVALRAAFITAMNEKQVAVLVPTTILAEQHYQTFKKRLSPFDIEVGVLSRLRSRLEIKNTLKGLEDGTVKVVIGTHRLLHSDVHFKDLGLIIIDEEHRFGVKQKEKLKQIKKTTKVLILSATPIPRSLQLSLLGIFDLSVIETPPSGRKTIQTVISRFDREVIRSAIEKELEKGGQVFFVHPRIQGLNSLAHLVKELVPRACVEVIHGQMPEELLERNLYRFLQREVDVLVCTPIIGSGIDMPSANTIIINRADLFGLADLYQLRGRVGRADEQAYAYLLVPELNTLNEEARRRLKALIQHSELGSGFKLAQSDLKIRGAGELLGLNQSGHINAVGYELYLELLENTVRALKGEKVEDWEPEVNLKVQAYIPQSFVPDPEERLSLYRELVLCRSLEELFALRDLLQDKYGVLPKEVKNLLKVYQLKLLMRRENIFQIEEKKGNILVTFTEQGLVPKLRRALNKAKDIRIIKVEENRSLRKVYLQSIAPALETALTLMNLL